MRKHAVVGSRNYPRLSEVSARIAQLKDAWEEWILVSGGAEGACFEAEQAALALGVPVVSFKVADITRNFNPEYIVEEWRLHQGLGAVIRHEPSWANWKSAVTYKTLLIAERADSADAFWNGESRGTRDEIFCFEREGVPCEVVRA